MTMFSSHHIRATVCIFALCGSPLAALADLAQRMAVLGNPEVVIRADDRSEVRVPAFCIDYARKAPNSQVCMNQYHGDVTVFYLNSQREWARYGTLQKAIENEVLAVEGMDNFAIPNSRGIGRYDSIRIRQGARSDGNTTFCVKFNGNALFGVDADDISSGVSALESLELLERYAAARHLPASSVQMAYWRLQMRDMADPTYIRDLLRRAER